MDVPLFPLGVDFFLYVERRGVDDKVAPVLLVLAAPDELRIEVAVAALVGHAHRILLFLLQDGLVFGGGDVLPLGLVVLERFDRLGGGWFLCHSFYPCCPICLINVSFSTVLSCPFCPFVALS